MLEVLETKNFMSRQIAPPRFGGWAFVIHPRVAQAGLWLVWIGDFSALPSLSNLKQLFQTENKQISILCAREGEHGRGDLYIEVKVIRQLMRISQHLRLVHDSSPMALSRTLGQTRPGPSRTPALGTARL